VTWNRPGIPETHEENQVPYGPAHIDQYHTQMMTTSNSFAAYALAIILAFTTTIAGAEGATTTDAFLKTHCVKCHNADKDKGDVRLDQLLRV
jgi:hypothetical protein